MRLVILERRWRFDVNEQWGPRSGLHSGEYSSYELRSLALISNGP